VKKLAVFLILFGSGLAAFGISGFEGSFSIHREFLLRDVYPDAYAGSFGWSLNNQIEIVIGVVSLIFGVILRIDSK
jgi:hypothetical protein